MLSAHLRPGDRVIVEDPCYPPIRDMLLALGLVPVPVAVDDSGLIPEAFEAGLGRGARGGRDRAPRPEPAGRGGRRARAGGAARRCWHPMPDVLIVEDDHASLVAGAPLRSIVGSSWPRWAVIRALSKMLHPDLRVALVAGDETTVARVEGRQALGPRWVSHILQATAAELLGDAGFDAGREPRPRGLRGPARGADRRAAERDVAAHGRVGTERAGSRCARRPQSSARCSTRAGW